VGYLHEHHRLVVSAETVRRVLRQAGVTWQRTKTWKASRDPDFATKMARVLDLYDHRPVEGRVLCVDEFVRHEALSGRAEVKGLRRRAVAAAWCS
jgi:hypothetical protein